MRRGDEDSLVELYRRHQAALFRFAVNMTGFPDVAQEAVQDAFLTLIRKPEAWRPERGTVQAFLYGITRNTTLRALQGHAEFGEIDFEIATGVDVLDELDRDERIRAVREGVLTLPPVYREAVVLCDIEEMNYDDAARLMQCPIGTVRSRVNRGRALLAAKLRGKFAGRPA